MKEGRKGIGRKEGRTFQYENMQNISRSKYPSTKKSASKNISAQNVQSVKDIFRYKTFKQ